MLKQHDRVLVERSGHVDWLALRVGPPQAYGERKRDLLLLLDSPGPKCWDDDDITADDEEEEEEEEDDLLADDDEDDEEDDDDDDDLDEEEE